MKKIAVIGSINMDLVVETDRLPKKGETILGNHFFSGPGGKGANQAVAISRLGGDVTFFGSIGKDYFGYELVSYLQKEKVKTVMRYDDTKSTGVALINLFDNDNNIIVVSGANDFYDRKYYTDLKKRLMEFDILLFQLEINHQLVFDLINYMSKFKKTIILNPAPAVKINKEILGKITYITPNEHECKVILGVNQSLEDVLLANQEKFIVTHGDQGVFFAKDDEIVNVPPIKVKNVIDTTGAGDTFSGSFAYAIAANMTVSEAVFFSNTAAGLSITKKGAQAGMPTFKQVSTFVEKWEEEDNEI